MKMSFTRSLENAVARVSPGGLGVTCVRDGGWAAEQDGASSVHSVQVYSLALLAAAPRVCT